MKHGDWLKQQLAQATIGSSNNWLKQQLRDPGFAAEYLTAAAEDTEAAVYLAALRKVAEARGIETMPLQNSF